MDKKKTQEVFKFISIQETDKKFKKNIKNLFFLNEEKIEEIVIVSAYFDLKALKWIYKFSKKNPNIEVKIFIDKHSSKIFSNDKINNTLIKYSKNIHIFLVRYGKLFHSKLYYIKSDKNIKVSIGSLNFTFNAFQRNEEILNEYIEDIDTQSEYISSIEEYIYSLEEKSEKVTKELKNKHSNSDLRSLLLDGYIYYESKEEESFSFKLELPNKMKKIDIEIDPTLKANLVDSLTLKRLILESPILKEIEFPKKEKGIGRWKDYCIETCYGYWSPSFFNNDLRRILEERKEKREPYFKKIKELLENHPKELENAFLDVCKSIKKNLPKGTYWEYADKNKAKKSWDKWRIKELQKFENETFYDRLIFGIIKVSPPDIWNDNLASEEFEDSFLDSIIYYWSKEYTRKIAKIIAWNLEKNNDKFNKDIDSNKLKKEIEKWLLKYQDNKKKNNIFLKKD